MVNNGGTNWPDYCDTRQKDKPEVYSYIWRLYRWRGGAGGLLNPTRDNKNPRPAPDYVRETVPSVSDPATCDLSSMLKMFR